MAELDRLFLAAIDEARDLGHHWVGVDHFLLALLSKGDGTAARRALEACGVSYEALRTEVTHQIEEADPPVKLASGSGISPNPMTYGLLGRAEGFALGLGAPRVEWDHLLVAILWEPRDSTQPYEALGVSREDIRDQLDQLGVDLPNQPLPEPDDTRWGERVFIPFEHMDAVVRELGARLPNDAPFGFNFERERRRAWVISGEDVDLDGLVREIVSRLES